MNEVHKAIIELINDCFAGKTMPCFQMFSLIWGFFYIAYMLGRIACRREYNKLRISIG